VAASALALYARVLAAADVRSAAQALAAELAAAHGLARVAVALWEGDRLQLQAISGLDDFDPQGDLPLALLGAMHEALEQGLSLAAPAAADQADEITIEQQALQRLLGGAVASIPVGDIDQAQALGAVVLQRADGAPLDAALVATLEHEVALALPALRQLARAQAPLHRIARLRLARWRERLRDPDRRATRRWLMGGAAALAALLLVPLPHDVGGRARVEGGQQRVLAAPTDGHVKAAHVRPGDRVRAGTVLLELMDDDLALQRERWLSQQAQHENAYAAAMARADRVQAALSQARLDEALAQVALVDEQLGRSRIRAPFDGLVVQGDLSQAIGAPVRQGDALVTLASADQPRVVVEVDETEVARVRAGQRGRLRVSSLPWDTHEVEVERIAPQAHAVDGRNVFDVHARMLAPADELRPGLQGRARIQVGWMPPLVAWLRPWLDRARLALWSLGA
jgi:RND family efflux transporter MFP subunit